MPPSSDTPARTGNLAGILCLCLGIALFSVQDLILKQLSGAYPLYEAMILRSLTALPLLFLLVWFDGGLRTLFNRGIGWMLFRGIVMFLAYGCYYLALAALPIATTVAIYFVAPLLITALSALVLGEHVGPRRWTAVAVGFAGVIIMLRPGSALFDWAALLVVASGLAYALSMISARWWGNFVFLSIATAMAAVLADGSHAAGSHPSLLFLLRGWVTPTLPDLLRMMACGVIAALGLTLLTQAYRIGESSAVAPFEYTAMLWGVLYGWTFFGDWPDTIAWLGIATIMASGLYVLYREGVRRPASPFVARGWSVRLPALLRSSRSRSPQTAGSKDTARPYPEERTE